jgi:hypothetical protein
MAAYLRRYGTFHADHILLVLSSHDLHDVPTFPAELGKDFPQEKPIFALEEALTRYLPRYLPARLHRAEAPSRKGSAVAARGCLEIENLIAVLRTSRVPFEVFLHPTTGELSSGANPDGKILRHLLETLGVNYIDMRPYLVRSDYRDEIHLNAVGQKRYGQRFLTQLRLTPTQHEARKRNGFK